jgi:hypothetical protein
MSVIVFFLFKNNEVYTHYPRTFMFTYYKQIYQVFSVLHKTKHTHTHTHTYKITQNRIKAY